MSVTEHTQSIYTCENLKSLFLTIVIYLNINVIHCVIHLNIVFPVKQLILYGNEILKCIFKERYLSFLSHICLTFNSSSVSCHIIPTPFFPAVGSEDVRYFHRQHHINRVAPVQEIDTAAMTQKVKYISDL